MEEYYSYLNSEVFALSPKEIGQIVKSEQAYIPKQEYIKLFGLNANYTYNFQSLLIDESGIITGDTLEYDNFDKFTLLPGKNYQWDSSITNPDKEIEEFIISNGIRQLRINLLRNSLGSFENHDCYVYPEIMSKIPAIYDTLYLTDYLLKMIFRILMAMVVNGADEEIIKQETFIIGIHDINGHYKVSNVEYNYGFLRIIDLASQFIENLGLKEKRAEIKAQYLEYKHHQSDRSILSASIKYQDIKYKCDDDINYEILPLKGEISLTYQLDGVRQEPPQHAVYLDLFFKEYYADIKRAFPIYDRLENIYRLCALNVIMNDFSVVDIIHDDVYIDTYARAISCSGGILLSPKNFIRQQIVNPVIPFIPAIRIESNKFNRVMHITRSLGKLPIQVGIASHSAILQIYDGKAYMTEYGLDGKSVVSQKEIPVPDNYKSFDFDGNTWIAVENRDNPISGDISPDKVKARMEAIVNARGEYTLPTNNCHMAVDDTLRAIGVTIDKPFYNDLRSAIEKAEK